MLGMGYGVGHDRRAAAPREVTPVPKLTDEDRYLILRARELGALDGPDAICEHTGEAAVDFAYIRAFGRAQPLLAELADLAERLGA